MRSGRRLWSATNTTSRLSRASQRCVRSLSIDVVVLEHDYVDARQCSLSKTPSLATMTADPASSQPRDLEFPRQELERVPRRRGRLRRALDGFLAQEAAGGRRPMVDKPPGRRRRQLGKERTAASLSKFASRARSTSRSSASSSVARAWALRCSRTSRPSRAPSRLSTS